MYGKYHIIKGDLFDISRRLKEIDKGYFAAYSYRKRRFEIHHNAQRGGSFCLAVPYPVLDARTVELVQKSRAERAERLLEEMEKNNQKTQRDLLYATIKNTENELERKLKKCY